jgi:hypothetical protein
MGIEAEGPDVHGRDIRYATGTPWRICTSRPTVYVNVDKLGDSNCKLKKMSA